MPLNTALIDEVLTREPEKAQMEAPITKDKDTMRCSFVDAISEEVRKISSKS